MPLTRDQIAEKVRSNLDDAGVTFYSEVDINDSLQDGFDDILVMTLPLEQSTDISFEDNKTYYNIYNAISDYILPLAIWLPEPGRWLILKNKEYFRKRDYQWELTHGTPIYYCVQDYKNIGFFPHFLQSDSRMFTIYYKSRGSELAASTEIKFSDYDEIILENYATFDLLEQAREFNKARIYLEQYQDSITKMWKMVEQRLEPNKILRLSHRITPARQFRRGPN